MWLGVVVPLDCVDEPILALYQATSRRENVEWNEDRGSQHDAKVELGPGGLHAEGHSGTDAARPVLSAQPNTS